ncbi:hypothetical protein QWI17_12370 [Gilvimarinus sp. SDUM040013]|uniref:Sulfotransferase family protein n=1 Tax=Gilvimarinus gilvus TaxID=3058038 RepID=A0ABU4RX64_9GAMM|nr:hypothetical protein [Gilvimarinus sp. SDUM040013]MDO3386633.1 hypothetical protein [Gilvimarinus sp. SDUM040013]MDX6849480.1 hypothetical protein [Gilvimarinus sp. SDUM040013]
MRPVILHYHLFKNAGTSIDTCLQQSFGDRWCNFDSPVGHTISADDIVARLHQQPELCAISSHDAAPPLPSGDFRVYPIVMLRHPVLRAKSAYLFECGVQNSLSTTAAGFQAYIDERTKDLNGGVITNFQACRLANRSPSGPEQVAPATEHEYARRAINFIDSLAFFGLVERFHESLVRLNFYLVGEFPDIQLRHHWQNATQRNATSVDEQLASIAGELGPDLYQRLIDRNQQDLTLYQYACERFATPLTQLN